jgi:hypothetical protein
MYVLGESVPALGWFEVSNLQRNCQTIDAIRCPLFDPRQATSGRLDLVEGSACPAMLQGQRSARAQRIHSTGPPRGQAVMSWPGIATLSGRDFHATQTGSNQSNWERTGRGTFETKKGTYRKVL